MLPVALSATATSRTPTPRPLTADEPVELWLGDTDPAGPAPASRPLDRIGTWDVRSARVVHVTRGEVVLATGDWGWPAVPGAPGTSGLQGALALVRRAAPEGIAEWQGVVAAAVAYDASGEVPVPGHAGSRGLLPDRCTPQHQRGDVLVHVRLLEAMLPGRLLQRRRSPRATVRLTPVRLTPLDLPMQGDGRDFGATPAIAPPDAAHGGQAVASFPAMAVPMDEDLLPVARLTDVSIHGAGVVVDLPLDEGTMVLLEFALPGERTPFTRHGKVVTPAVPVHGDMQPQADGLPAFRRGIEFLHPVPERDARRLAAAVDALRRQSERR